MKGDSTNAISWASNRRDPLWKLVNIVRDIKRPCSHGGITFTHVAWSANNVADFLAKVGVQKRRLALEFF